MLLNQIINDAIGMVPERKLQRSRFVLIACMMRFLRPSFQITSLGGPVVMITGETEPMGGMMGRAGYRSSRKRSGVMSAEAGHCVGNGLPANGRNRLEDEPDPAAWQGHAR